MSKAVFTAEQLETLLSRVLATAIDKFDACLDKMMDKFESRLAKVYDELSTANRRIDKLEQSLKQQVYDRDYPALSLSTVVGAASTSWSNQTKDMMSVQAPTQKQPVKPPVVTRIGKRPANNSLKVIKPPLTCFVGRLDPDTTAEDLKQYLSDVGIKDADCWKLQAKDGRVFKTAAFRVSCREEFRDLFHNEDNWPEGAELRDWVFRKPSGQPSPADQPTTA